jgi:hypothetical protein
MELENSDLGDFEKSLANSVGLCTGQAVAEPKKISRLELTARYFT